LFISPETGRREPFGRGGLRGDKDECLEMATLIALVAHGKESGRQRDSSPTIFFGRQPTDVATLILRKSAGPEKAMSHHNLQPRASSMALRRSRPSASRASEPRASRQPGNASGEVPFLLMAPQHPAMTAAWSLTDRPIEARESVARNEGRGWPVMMFGMYPNACRW
jgi:hypothetical protein